MKEREVFKYSVCNIIGDILQIRTGTRVVAVDGKNGVFASLLDPKTIRSFAKDIAPGRESVGWSAYANLALHARTIMRGDLRCTNLEQKTKRTIAEKAANTYMIDKTERTFEEVVTAEIKAHLNIQ